MFIFLSLLQLSLSALTLASPVGQSIRPRTSGLQWGPCLNYSFSTPLECSTLSVPLDYTDPDVGTLDLEILRLKSNSTKSKGSIFLNFGGPGDDGRESFDVFGPMMQSMTGGCYDLVSIVPRGTNNTLLFSCYSSDTARSAAPSPPSGNSSDVAIDTIWAQSAVFVEGCAVNQNETGRFVGTAFTARDHMAVIDALGEDGMIRYWGVSYGTVLGATLAAMFPDKIDKMVLDGVVNSHEYYQNKEVQIYEDSDKVFDTMLAACAEAPTLCPLAHNRTAEELQTAMYEFLEDLKYNPIPLTLSTGDGLVADYTFTRNLLSNALYSPGSWPKITKFYNNIIERNVTGVLEYILGLSSAFSAEAQFGIKCGDVVNYDDMKEDVRTVLEARHAQSKAIGDTGDYVVTRCAQWKLPAKERYSGDFQVKTSNPLLLIGNTGDPVTPLASARNMSSGFEGSVVLEHGGFGHASVLTQASRCTVEALRAYFENSTLPKDGTVCAIEQVPFGVTGWDELLSEIPATCPS